LGPLLFAPGAGFLAPGTASAESVVIAASRDTTLIEDVEGARGNGAGPFVFVGRVSTAEDSRRRAVIQFDIAGHVPAGSTIVDVSLTLYLAPSNEGTETVAVHRLLAEWGESTSSLRGGQGAPSEPGDATWIHTFYADGFWARPGGDFVASSASAAVSGAGFYAWGATAGMIADVQRWLDDPAGNHGWLLRGNEAAPSTAKKFASRENDDPSLRPALVVEFVRPERDEEDDEDRPRGRGPNASDRRWRPHSR
jgi:hypothetical protein